MLDKVLSAYDIHSALIKPHGKGLINRTWLVKAGKADYILQKINQNVFKSPEDIADNIELIDSYVKKNHPRYFLPTPLKTQDGRSMVFDPGQGCYRLFSFVKGSQVFDVVQKPEQAFEAARQFGLFTHSLSGLALQNLKPTLPGFHDLVKRYEQFKSVVANGNDLRIKEAKKEIRFLQANEQIVSVYEKIKNSKEFRSRVIHHDTKISNVLFDQKEKAICVIDLDTVMPGYFISDVGDMMRTYLSPVNEEEKDLSKIEVREDYFEAIIRGYFSEMGNELTKDEVRHFVYAGMFMIYMQALRFLTDHLNNDIYYGISYEGHNYVRAKNQITLLKALQEKETLLNDMVLKA
jgi:Ser/Thr protein kinase RdoA (MazF antagonist)